MDDNRKYFFLPEEEDRDDIRGNVTVSEMIEMLKKVPGHLEVRYDGGYGVISKRFMYYNDHYVVVND